jgi:hypothetical protein
MRVPYGEKTKSARKGASKNRFCNGSFLLVLVFDPLSELNDGTRHHAEQTTIQLQQSKSKGVVFNENQHDDNQESIIKSISQRPTT